MPDRGARAGDALGALERVLLLKRTPLLRAVADDVVAALAEAARERYLPAGQEILGEDDPPASLYFVASGEITMRWRGVELGRVGAWGPVAGLHAFLQRDAGLRAATVSDTLALQIGTDAFADILEDHFELAHALLRHLAGDLLDLSELYGCPPALAGPEPGAERRLEMEGPGLDLVQRMMLLKDLRLLSRASLTTLAHLARGLEETAAPSGTELWVRGDPSGQFLLILEGLARCDPAAPSKGFEQGPGSSPGLVELLAGRPRQHALRTLAPLRALRGPGEALVDCMEDDAELALQVMAVLARETLSLVAASGEGPEALGRLLGCSRTGSRAGRSQASGSP